MKNQQSLFQSDQASFQDERKSGMGGSDAGAVYNLGFKCGRQTAYSKIGLPEDFRKIESAELERGILCEPVALSCYERRTGRSVKLLPLARHPDHDWMIVHVDGETTSPQHAGPGYVEFKVLHWKVLKKFKQEGIRDEYILQLQHGMAVKGYSWGSFGMLCLDPWRFEWFDVERDDDLISKLIQDESRYWNDIHSGIMPARLELPSDKRCQTCPWRRTCRGEQLLGELPDSAEGTEEPVRDDTLAPLVQEVSELKAIVADAKELEEEACGRLKAAIGKRYGIIVPGFRALNCPSWPERVDSNALKSLESEAKKILATEREDWDLDSLEARCTELLSIVIGLSKVRKQTPKDMPQRSLRIYPTGD